MKFNHQGRLWFTALQDAVTILELELLGLFLLFTYNAKNGVSSRRLLRLEESQLGKAAFHSG